METLSPGSGWVAADVQVSHDAPLAASIEAGLRLSPDWSAWGDAWVQPTLGRFGADVGARFNHQLDMFAGGWADTAGRYGAQAGLKWRF